MNRKLILLLVFVGIGILVSTGNLHAAFRVENTAQIVYYSNVLCVFSYTFTDTARIVVLYGPSMTIAKYVRNEVTLDTSPNQVPAGRGDTITILLYSGNDLAGSDTSAWHVFIYDTFTQFTGVGGQNASVGSDETVDSFTYVPFSETVVYEIFPDSVVLPTSITYWVDGEATWKGSFNPATRLFSGTWANYSSATKEADVVGGNSKVIVGIMWYWRYVPSAQYYNQASEGMAYTGLPCKTQVKFQVKKNDN